MLIVYCIFSQSICLCSQGAVGQGTEAANLGLDSDGEVVPHNLREANLVDSLLGEGQPQWNDDDTFDEYPTCKAGCQDCSKHNECCDGYCNCFFRTIGGVATALLTAWEPVRGTGSGARSRSSGMTSEA